MERDAGGDCHLMYPVNSRTQPPHAPSHLIYPVTSCEPGSPCAAVRCRERDRYYYQHGEQTEACVWPESYC